MGITAENVAEKYGITREMQDEIALASQPVSYTHLDVYKRQLPDTHLLRFLNQLLTEIRMRNRDQSLRTLPCSQRCV